MGASASCERLRAEQGAGVTGKQYPTFEESEIKKTERSILKNIVFSVCPWLEGAVCHTAPSVSLFQGYPVTPLPPEANKISPTLAQNSPCSEVSGSQEACVGDFPGPQVPSW